MAQSILDLMTPEHRAKAEASAKKRLDASKTERMSVAPEAYVLAELGMYFNWQAVVDAKRGYIDYRDSDGNYHQSIFTLEEAVVMVEAAKKVRYAMLIDEAHAAMIASASKYSKTPGETFNKNMKPFIDRAKN